MKEKCLYVGSFDPITLGHCSVLEQVMSRYSMRVGVAYNAGKTPIFSLPERLSMTQDEMRHMSIDPLSVSLIPGSVARYAKRYDIPHIVRGQRNIVDEVGESSLAHFYHLENTGLDIEILPAHGDLRYASSSAAKDLVRASHDVRSVVSIAVKEALESRLIQQYPLVITGSMGSGKSTYAQDMVVYARSVGIPITHIDFDAIAHEIYNSLTEPLYANTRASIQREFNLPDTSGGWIHRSALRTALLQNKEDVNSPMDPVKIAKLESLIMEAMIFRYRDKIQGTKGIILIDGATLVDKDVSYLGNHHVLIVDASKDTRIERVVSRYRERGDTISPQVIESLFSLQSTQVDKKKKIESHIKNDGNGSIHIVENNSTDRDARKAFFCTLGKIDRFGELRTSLIYQFLGITENHDVITSELKKRYDSPGRYYHTWGHIIACLDELFEAAINLNLSDEDVATIGAAILFHDSVYEVTSGDFYRKNEKRSAKLSRYSLKSYGVGKKKREEIYTLIRETAYRRVPLGKNLRSHLLHDIDKSILGASDEVYRVYGNNIRIEHSLLMNGPVFENARNEKFLIPTLGEERIYLTEYFQQKYENTARRNMQAELKGEISFEPRV